MSLGRRQLRARGRAVRALARGAIILYPTEAVWGLGCDPANDAALARLLQVKRRALGKGLILVAGELQQLRPWTARFSRKQQARLEATWPGPHTWVVPARLDAPPGITGRRRKIAVRVSAHPDVRRLCRAHGGALVSTSANLSGRPPVRAEWPARRLFRAVAPVVWPGALGGEKRPSTIRDLQTGSWIRK